MSQEGIGNSHDPPNCLCCGDARLGGIVALDVDCVIGWDTLRQNCMTNVSAKLSSRKSHHLVKARDTLDNVTLDHLAFFWDIGWMLLHPLGSDGANVSVGLERLERQAIRKLTIVTWDLNLMLLWLDHPYPNTILLGLELVKSLGFVFLLARLGSSRNGHMSMLSSLVDHLLMLLLPFLPFLPLVKLMAHGRCQRC